jgi:integrase
MRFRRPNGAPAKLTLGPFDATGMELKGEPVVGAPLTVAAARQLAAAVLRERAKGSDVFADHKAAKQRQRFEHEQAAANAFGPLVRQFIQEHGQPRVRRWRAVARVLGLVYPLDGGEPTETKGGLAQRWATRPVTEIDGDDIHAVIDEAQRHGIPGTKRRTKGLSDARGRHLARALSKFFSWVHKRRLIKLNPCSGVGAPPPPPARERVLTPAEIKLVWQASAKLGGPFGAMVQLLLLTGQRRDEVARMERAELAADGLWSMPGTRVKNRRPHAVPLPDTALKIVRSMPVMDGCRFVFSTNTRSPISGFSKGKAQLDAQMLALAQQANPAAVLTPWRLHDLRRTFVTGAVEIGIQPHVVEAVVNHVSGHKGGVAGTYNRSELLPERRAALQRWATHVQGIVSGKRGGNVIALKRGRT